MGTHEVPAYDRPRTSLFDVRGLAGFLGVSRASVYRLVARGELVPVRVGERLRFRPEDVDAYLASDRKPGP
jgi:excisionase family DNA binding protein